MQSGRRQGDDEIARCDASAVDQFTAIDDPDDKSGDVIFAVPIESGHLRRFTADQRTVAFAAAARQPVDDLFNNLRIEFAGRDVIEKEKRPGPLDQNVVDAMPDEIVADSVVDIHSECDL